MRYRLLPQTLNVVPVILRKTNSLRCASRLPRILWTLTKARYRGEDKESYVSQPIMTAILTLFLVSRRNLRGLGQDETAKSCLGGSITNVVVTIPVRFNDSQCQATRGAATIRGLNVLRTTNEPAATCTAYGLNKEIIGELSVQSASPHRPWRRIFSR